MGVPIPEMVPVDNASAEALLSSLEGMTGAERRKHASMFNYWLSIRGDRQFPPIRDLDPLEISDAGPWSVLLEMIGAGENAVIRHLGQAIKLGVEAETIARAPAPSLLACIHDKLPLVASSMQVIAFEDSFEADGETTRCWVTLLPFSTTGASIDYVYGFVSLDGDQGMQSEPQQQVEELESGQVPLGPLDEDPATVDGEAELADPTTEVAEPIDQPQIEVETELDTEPAAELDAAEPDLAPLAGIEPELEPAPEPDPEPVAELEPELEAVPEPEQILELESEPLPEQFDPEDTPQARAGFSAKLMESVSGFYGRVVHAAPDDAVEAEPAMEDLSDPIDAPAEAEAPQQITEPTNQMEGSLQSKLSEVRAMAEEARQAQLRSQLALLAGLSAAYDFALDAESEPEEYLRLVEGQGLKIQLRAPMKPVVKLAFAETCDEATIAQLEAVLAWALKQDLPRGSLAERIESEGGMEPILQALGKAA